MPLSVRHSLLISLSAIFLIAALSVANAQIFQTKARQALLIDWDSGSVLFSKDAQSPFPPASLAKLMTLEVVFNALEQGELSMEDEFLISENAWRKGGGSSGGSTMFAKLNSSIPLSALLNGIIVQSGNDACIAIAEGMAGNEESFSELMNARAQEIGLTGSNFVNSTGLPAENQYVTAQDLAKLTRHLIKTYPDYYKYFSIPEFTWNKITQRNRNPLLGQTQGADGLKTGYTKASGYGVVASVLRNDQRLILIMSGMKSKKERALESRKIIDWGFRAFVSQRLYETNEEIAFADVHGGNQAKVMLVSEKPISLFMPRSKRGKLKARVVYQGPIKAPIEEGSQLATLKIWTDDQLVMEAPLVAAHSVDPGTLTQRALDGLHHLLLGWL
ncbi:MAG: D-alanyl-D-alanine carboxypeptidase [Cohaesibacter sp.]|nr:D-alanyl-D-alanine carboxypeptidase [Cohaesibacter sp.]